MSSSIIEENFGKWKSFISAKDIAKKSSNYMDICVDNGVVYWTESRPWENGKNFIVSYTQKDKPNDETTNQFNISTGVHGYGGGAFIVKNNIIYFYDSLTCQIYKKNRINNKIVKITRDENYQYADFCIDSQENYIYCIRLHKSEEFKFSKTEIVRIKISDGEQEILFTGADFYSNIRVNSNSTQLLFLQWNYPHMPWDENELWIAEILPNNKINHLKKISHKKNVSHYQPEWENDKIFCAINENNYWQVCSFENGCFSACFNYPADFGRPLWVAGTKIYSFISPKKLIANCIENGIWKTFLLDLHSNTHQVIHNNLTCINNIATDNKTIVYIGGNTQEPLNIYVSQVEKINLTIKPKSSLEEDLSLKFKDEISTPKLIEFISQGKKVYAFYYAPKNTRFKNKNNEAPPCIIKIHGGPTSCADYLYNSKIQFFTSRGYAYVELNYGGSSGYGKEYRNRLNKMWGIVDVQDTIACAEYLCNSLLADKNKLILAGSSAGGFTLLNVLVQTNLFKCATCHYGVADLVELANSIHKFEACYDQNLIGDTINNNIELYKRRSPINFVRNISTPIIFFHGNKDSVVHMNQSLKITEELSKHNIYYEIYIFDGEGHGFKKEETIIDVLEKELNFFDKFF